MHLWDMDVAELLWVSKTDTIALLAYSHDKAVLAFKGTSSVANCKTNLNVRWWLIVRPPVLVCAPSCACLYACPTHGDCHTVHSLCWLRSTCPQPHQ